MFRQREQKHVSWSHASQVCVVQYRHDGLRTPAPDHSLCPLRPLCSHPPHVLSQDGRMMLAMPSTVHMTAYDEKSDHEAVHSSQSLIAVPVEGAGDVNYAQQSP
jgi:hypothetical protein